MAEFRKLNWYEKFILKQKDIEAYKDYKYHLALSKITPIDLNFPQKDAYHFKHSGNSGDIMYALPTIYALAGSGKAHLHLVANAPASYGKRHHPLGNVMLNEKMIEMITPLLLAQEQISSCTTYTADQPIDFDLDLFRSYPLLLNRGNIARWYFYIYAINADLGKPWLKVDPDTSVNDRIVVARSHRYQAPGISYTFLKKYKTVFIGVEQEYRDMKKEVPNIEYRPVKNFLDMAGLIAGSRLFIGNQSFPFSISEGLKVKRLLEMYHFSPNVNVEGPNGYDFYFQPQFEKLVAQLYGSE
jgi:hypothetical protein